ncbi:hypothetical protein BDR22DRAFT_827794 [Usnea florida]
MSQHRVSPAPAPPDAAALEVDDSSSSHAKTPTSPLLFHPREIYNQIDTLGPSAGDASELSDMDPPPAHDLGPLTTKMNKDSLTTMPAGHIFSLPRELRDDIYIPLLRAGSVAILRASKQIHDEAKEHLFHEATFRVKMGFACGRINSFPTNWKEIETYHFRINVGFGNTLPVQPTFRLFDRFTDLDGTKARRECLVSIEYDHDPTALDDGSGFFQPAYPSSLCDKLTCLKTFTTVAVEFVPNGSWEAWRRKSPEHPGHPGPSDADGRMAYTWMLLEWHLTPELGTARHDILKDGEEPIVEQRLVFHPQQYHSSLAGDGVGVSVKE